jgi:hypothetical protein
VNIRLKQLGLSIAIVLLVTALPAALAWDEAVSTQDPGNTAPGFGGNLNAPWQNQGAAVIPNVVGTKIWIAVENIHIPVNRKTVSLTVNLPPGNDLECDGVSGYYNGGANQSQWVGNSVTETQNGDGTVTFTATLDPQPEWEVFELEITGRGGRGGDYCPEPEGHSNCVQVRPYPNGLDLIDAVYDGPYDAYELTEIWVVPETGYVDMSWPPVFFAPPHTGEWYSEYVFADPEGNPLPQGAVRFFTEGPGIQTQDAFNLYLPMYEPAEWYWLHEFDALEGSWGSFRLGAGEGQPECPGDVDGDGDVDLGDLAILLASYGTAEGDAGYNPAADLDGDGMIGLSDLAALLSVYGMICE